MNENIKNALKSVKIDMEKLDCIIFYAKKKNKDFSVTEFLQGAVNQAIDKAFVKYVPKQVRMYLASKQEPKSDPKQEPDGQNSGKVHGA